MSNPTRMLVEITETYARNVLTGLAKAGMIRLVEDPSPPDAPAEEAVETKGCECCGTVGPVTHMPIHPELGAICILCMTAADRLKKRFTAAARRSYREFHGQLRQMVRDVRSGAEYPTFYQGNE